MLLCRNSFPGVARCWDESPFSGDSILSVIGQKWDADVGEEEEVVLGLWDYRGF